MSESRVKSRVIHLRELRVKSTIIQPPPPCPRKEKGVNLLGGTVGKKIRIGHSRGEPPGTRGGKGRLESGLTQMGETTKHASSMQQACRKHATSMRQDNPKSASRQGLCPCLVLEVERPTRKMRQIRPDKGKVALQNSYRDGRKKGRSVISQK